MKKRAIAFMLVVAMGLALTACGGTDKKDKPGNSEKPQTEQNQNNNTDKEKEKENGENKPDEKPDNEGSKDDNSGGEGTAITATSTPDDMIKAILGKIEQPALVDIEADMIKEMYFFDPAIAEQAIIKTPMMNTKTNEIAIVKVKDAADVAKVEEGMKKRAEAVQKQFETYLPDQYENAKKFKTVAKDNYVLFVISEDADKIVEMFNGFFIAQAQ